MARKLTRKQSRGGRAQLLGEEKDAGGEELRRIVVRRGYKITSAATLQLTAAEVVH